MGTEIKTIRKIIPQIFKLAWKNFLREEKQVVQKQVTSDIEDVVTEADKEIEEILIKTLRKNFPDDKIFSEERGIIGPQSSERLWFLDALCGSGNFTLGILSFATNISLLENERPIFACVLDHSLREYIWTDKERNGIYVNQEAVILKDTRFKAETVIHIDFGYLRPHLDKEKTRKYSQLIADLIKEGKFTLRMPSTSLTFTYVALRKIGAFIVPNTEPWDIVSACYLIEKSGGIATDFSGKPWSYKSKDIVASHNKKTHKILLEKIQDFDLHLN